MTEGPVVIVGAGVCGLTAAMVLQRHEISYVILEKAKQAETEVDVGCGWDISPAVLKVFEKCDLKPQDFMGLYSDMHLLNMSGGLVRHFNCEKDLDNYQSWAVERSTLIKTLRSRVAGEVRYGCAVAGVTEDESGATVQLEGGDSVKGRAVLGCDGVNSAVRAAIGGQALAGTGIQAWWGRAQVQPGSPLADAITKASVEKSKTGTLVWYLGDGSNPGCFMAALDAFGPGSFPWAAYLEGPKAEVTGDAPRQGAIGGVKDNLTARLAGRADLFTQLVAATPGELVYTTHLYERSDPNAPYKSSGGRVALLGDAAHPQTPFKGMAVNMAIVDAFVLGSRLAKQPVVEAIAAYDSEERRKAATHLVEEGRSWGSWMVTSSTFKTWAFRVAAKWMPSKNVIADFIKDDQANMVFLDKALADLGMA